MEPKNKTLSIELEDIKKQIIDALYDEEIALWHGSDPYEGGFNIALRRAIEVVREVK